MPSTINALSTGSGGLVQTADASGVLQLQTNGTTALTVDTNANVTFPGYISAPNTFGFKNRIINGAMVIDQRNAGASVALGSGTTAGNYLGYPVDRFVAQSYSVTAGNGAAFTAQRNAGAVTPPTGFTNYVGVTVTSTQATLQNDSIYRFIHRIEGFNVADLGWGAAGAQTITISFWVRSSVAGTFTGCVTNAGPGGGWRSYPFTFTINATNTWEQKSVTIVGDTTGTWVKDNGNGLELSISFGASTSFAKPAGAWIGAEAYAANGGVNLMATNGATFYITGVQLEKGSTATPFDYRPYGTELALCQRYYFKKTVAVEGGGISAATAAFDTISGIQQFFPVEMRTTPTLTLLGTTARSGGTANDQRISTTHFVWGNKQTGSGTAQVYAYATGGFTVESEL